MDILELPQHFLFESSVSHTCKIWLKWFRFYLTVTEKYKKDDKIKTSILLTYIGRNGREIYKTFTFNLADDDIKLEPVLN